MLSLVRAVPVSFPNLPKYEQVANKPSHFRCSLNEGGQVTFSLPR